MKKTILLSFIVCLAMSFTGCEDITDELANPDRVEMNVNDLPSVVTNYIAANYPNDTIEGAATNLDENAKMFYEVFMSNGLELEFDLEGTFLRIDESNDDEGCGRDRGGVYCGNGG